MSEGKPPPIVLGVEGIDASGAMGEKYDWYALSKLPPFQSWIASIEPNPNHPDFQVYAFERATAMVQAQGGKAVWDAYATWFKAKGTWPNNNPDGTKR